MEPFRRHGSSPFRVAAIHGGPGAPGEVAPVARELARSRGVLEPFQSAVSLEGQITELETLLASHGDGHWTLIGHSWGAWLIFLLAARAPSVPRKLILVGSGPFEEPYAESILGTRLSRLTEEQRAKALAAEAALDDPAVEDKTDALAEFGKWMTKADTFDPLPWRDEVLAFHPDVFEKVWPEAAALRRSGELLERGREIRCPVVAIHGDHDAHPAEGVREPLSRVLGDFRFVLLPKCGHTPWIERHARDEFFRVLERELGGA
ncbi:MAG: alpha/beta fold hydrolase [Planctomycetota bacterium]